MPVTSTNGRILCVDDNYFLESALTIGLGSYGFDVVTACHGLDALIQYKALHGHFSAIVTDNEMPKMNGLELVRSVREMGYLGSIVVISGNLNIRDLQNYKQYTITGFLQKPFEIKALADLLEKAVK